MVQDHYLIDKNNTLSTSSTLAENWLDLATAHGSTQWLKQFIQTYLPQLKDQHLSAEALAQALDQELQSRQLTTPAQQKNYRSNLCQALKTLDSDHPAIALIAPTPQQYRELNDAQRGRLADRPTRFLTSDQAQSLVNRATALLESAEWSEVAAALAVLIGRRISEILLSQFSLYSPWSLHFCQMAKKAHSDGLTIEIPTLAPAQQVIAAILKLQRSLLIDDLKLTSLSPKLAKQTVNTRFSDAVARQCNHHFRDLIPTRSDRDNLYTHIFRAVYASIAAHWFCPPTVPEHSFKAEIQGHFTLSQDGKKLPNYSARANYDDYAIGTPDDNRDGRLGIKLGQLPDLQVIEAFRAARPQLQTHPISHTALTPLSSLELEPIVDSLHPSTLPPQHLTPAQAAQPHVPSPDLDENSTMPNLTPKPKTRRPELLLDDLERMSRLMAQQGFTGSAAQLFHALLDTFQTLLSKEQQQQIHSMGELTTSLNWFTHRIDTLETTCNQLQAQRDKLLANHAPSDQLQLLQAENAHLTQQLQHTQARLLSIQLLLGISAHSDTAQPNAPQSAPAPELNATASSPPTAALNLVANPATNPATTLPASPLPQSPTIRRNRADTTDKLNLIIDALISWNTAQPSSDTQLRISFPTIKALASPLGVNYQPVIQAVLKERAVELDEHHRRLLIGSRHNAAVVKKDALLQSIARDYLAITNWQDVKYAG